MNDNIPVQPRELTRVHERLDEIGIALNTHLIEEATNFQAMKDASENRDNVLNQILAQTKKTNGRVNDLENFRRRIVFVSVGIVLSVTVLVNLIGVSLKLTNLFGGML
jgi:hypothetical protein